MERRSIAVKPLILMWKVTLGCDAPAIVVFLSLIMFLVGQRLSCQRDFPINSCCGIWDGRTCSMAFSKWSPAQARRCSYGKTNRQRERAQPGSNGTRCTWALHVDQKQTLTTALGAFEKGYNGITPKWPSCFGNDDKRDLVTLVVSYFQTNPFVGSVLRTSNSSVTALSLRRPTWEHRASIPFSGI